jgi:hypothetical protein
MIASADAAAAREGVSLPGGEVRPGQLNQQQTATGLPFTVFSDSQNAGEEAEK